MLKQILLATLVFVACVIGYNIYKYLVTKRAFKQASTDESLVLLHKGGDESLPALNIPRNYPTFFGICFGQLDEKYVFAVGDVYNITFTKTKGNEPYISYHETSQEAVAKFFSLYQQAGGQVARE